MKRKPSLKVTKVRMWKRWGVFGADGELRTVTNGLRLAKFMRFDDETVKPVHVTLHEKSTLQEVKRGKK